ncbi:hypothetical protein MASR1M31_03390 [Porphyromonadaceae bacterium]
MEEQDNIIRTEIKIADLNHGMIVERDVELITVSRKHINYNYLTDTYTFQGDAYRQTITRVQWKVPIKNGYRITD